MTKDHAKLIIDYTHNTYSCQKHVGQEFDDLISKVICVGESGFYKRNYEKIASAFYSDTKSEIIQILARTPLNALQLKGILRYSYPTIHKHIKDLVSLKLVKITRGKSGKGKKELKLTLHDNIQVEPLTMKSREIIDSINRQIKQSEETLPKFNAWLHKEIKRVAKLPTNRLTEKFVKRNPS